MTLQEASRDSGREQRAQRAKMLGSELPCPGMVHWGSRPTSALASVIVITSIHFSFSAVK